MRDYALLTLIAFVSAIIISLPAFADYGEGSSRCEKGEMIERARSDSPKVVADGEEMEESSLVLTSQE